MAHGDTGGLLLIIKRFQVENLCLNFMFTCVVYEVVQGCLCPCVPVLAQYLIGVFRPKQCLGPSEKFNIFERCVK